MYTVFFLAANSAMGMPASADEENCQTAEGAHIKDGEESQKILLFGMAEIDDTPMVDLFEQKVRLDSQLPCSMKNKIYRLTRVARDARIRLIVWQRMKVQELRWESGKTLHRIENIAASCNMPLTERDFRPRSPDTVRSRYATRESMPDLGT